MVTVKLNLQGINKIMTGPGASALVRREAKRMAEAAGPGFEAVIHPHRWTARGYVQTADEEGRRRQANEHVLERIATDKS